MRHVYQLNVGAVRATWTGAIGLMLLGSLPLALAALDDAPPASVHPGWGKKRRGASHQIVKEE